MDGCVCRAVEVYSTILGLSFSFATPQGVVGGKISLTGVVFSCECLVM